MGTSVEFVNVITTGSPITLVALFVFALLKRWLVLPREIDAKDERLKELEGERDEYKDMAFRALNVGEYMATQTEGNKR